MTDTENSSASIGESHPVPPTPAPGAEASSEATKESPFDSLMITPEEAERRAASEKTAPPDAALSESSPEEPEQDDGPILAEEVAKICKAIDRLSKKGLNMRAVIALLHDSNPTISKKVIKAVLEGLRELPVIYSRESVKR